MTNTLKLWNIFWLCIHILHLLTCHHLWLDALIVFGDEEKLWTSLYVFLQSFIINYLFLRSQNPPACLILNLCACIRCREQVFLTQNISQNHTVLYVDFKLCRKESWRQKFWNEWQPAFSEFNPLLSSS